MDDITFCLSDCQRTDCYRHPSNIQDRTIPHSYADFKGTETCPEFAKDINAPINDSISRQAAVGAFRKELCAEETESGRDYIIGFLGIERVLNDLPSVQPEQSSEIQDILEYLDTVLHPIISPDHWNVYSELHDMISMLPSAQPETSTDFIDRRAAVNEIDEWIEAFRENGHKESAADAHFIKVGIGALPSAHPERMTNRQWVDFLSAQFDISRTSAKEMLHGMMRWKKEDNFKKMFNGGKT